MVTLYLNQEDKEAASEVLVQTVNWYNKNQVRYEKNRGALNVTGLGAGCQLVQGGALVQEELVRGVGH